MDSATLQLIIALAPVVEKLVVSGVEIFMRTDMTTEQRVAALEAAKAGFPEMTVKP